MARPDLEHFKEDMIKYKWHDNTFDDDKSLPFLRDSIKSASITIFRRTVPYELGLAIYYSWNGTINEKSIR